MLVQLESRGSVSLLHFLLTPTYFLGKRKVVVHSSGQIGISSIDRNFYSIFKLKYKEGSVFLHFSEVLIICPQTRPPDKAPFRKLPTEKSSSKGVPLHPQHPQALELG